MDMTPSYVASALLLPPTLLLLLALAALALMRRRQRLGAALCALCLVATLALSTRAVADVLLRSLEPPPLQAPERAGAQAIVVLGSGRNLGAPEYGGETVSGSTLENVRYGARLARATGLPLLVTGGRPTGGSQSEAQLMRGILEREFGLPVRWVDPAADTTRDNALNSAALLAPSGVERVLLVTAAAKMPRAAAAFERAGLHVIAAPTSYAGQHAWQPTHLIPSAESLPLTYLALREWAAILWYRLRG